MKKRVLYLTYAALAVMFSTAESLLPRPFMGVKIGMANIITLIMIYHYGLKPAFSVLIIRIMTTSLITGTFLAPGFYLSLSGALTGFGITAFFFMIVKKHVSPVGLSVAGALFNNSTQLAVAVAFLGFSPALFSLYWLLVFFSLITGTVTGCLSSYIIFRLKRMDISRYP